MTPRRLLAGLILFAAGCGSAEPPKGTGTPSGKDGVTDLGVLLKEFADQGKRPPAKLADIDPVEPAHQAAHVGLTRGDIVYVWGVGLSPGSAAVLAYEKQAAADGGWVLLQDGTVKTLTAAEFGAAAKAKKQ